MDEIAPRSCASYIQPHVVAYLSSGPPRRTPPAGFILPCQPLLVDRPPVGPAWLHEIKHDGYRILARQGTNFTDRLPKIAEAVCSLAVGSALIDGEA